MNWTSYTALTDAADVLDKLHTFLVARGWTIKEYQTAVQWKSTTPFGWISGSETFMDFESPIAAVGSQHYRYHLTSYHYDATDDCIRVGAVDPSVNSGNYSLITTHPTIQTANSHIWGPGSNSYDIRMPRVAGITGCWFFENGYSFWCVIQPTVGTNIIWGLGTPNLLPEYYNVLDVQNIWMPSTPSQSWTLITTNPNNFWFSGDSFPFELAIGSGNTVRVEGVIRAYNANYLLLNCAIGHNTLTGYSSVYFDKLNAAVTINNFNIIRPGIVPDVYVKRLAGQYECIGSLPLAKIKTSGLAIGDHLIYGSEEFIAFPNLSPSSTDYGTMWRIV